METPRVILYTVGWRGNKALGKIFRKLPVILPSTAKVVLEKHFYQDSLAHHLGAGAAFPGPASK
jgi:hypothetical protein